MNDMLGENKRKTTIIADKQAELTRLREELDGCRGKAQERDKLHTQVKDLLSKQFALQSALDMKDRKINDQKKEMDAMNERGFKI